MSDLSQLFDTSFFYVFIIALAALLAALSQATAKIDYLKNIFKGNDSFSVVKFFKTKGEYAHLAPTDDLADKEDDIYEKKNKNKSVKEASNSTRVGRRQNRESNQAIRGDIAKDVSKYLEIREAAEKQFSVNDPEMQSPLQTGTSFGQGSRFIRSQIKKFKWNSLDSWKTIFIKIKKRINLNSENKQYNPYLFWASFLVLTIPLGFRFYIGADYHSYYYWFDLFDTQGLAVWADCNFEVGYSLLTYFCTIFFDTPISVIFIVGAATNFFFYKGFAYESRRISLGIAVFAYGFVLYLHSYVIIRNILAVSIIFFGLRYLFKEEFRKFVVCVLIASSIHITAIIFLPLGLAYARKLRSLRIIYALGLYVLVPIVPILSSWLADVFIDIIPHFQHYYEGFKNLAAEFDTRVYTRNSLILCIPMFFIYFFARRKRDSHISLYLSFFLVTISLAFFTISEVMVERYMHYFSVGFIMMLAGSWRFFSRVKIIRVVLFALIMMFGKYEIETFVNDPIYAMLPYNSIIDDVKLIGRD